MTSERPIGQLIERLIDYRGKTPTKTDSGVPLITAKVIKGGRILTSALEFIAEETYEAWMRRGLPREGDILITTEAPLGEVAQIGQEARVALAQRVILLRPDSAEVDPQFLFHFLRSPMARQRLRRRASGTTVSGIRQPELRALEVCLLPRAEQEKVGIMLDGLDNQIENNRRRIELLEQMAQAIYWEWFVRFRYPGQGDPALVDSPLGPIPEDWQIRPVGAIANLDRTSVQPHLSPDETFDHYSIPAFDDSRLPVADRGDRIKSGKFLLTGAAVLVSKLNPRIERTWFAEPSPDRRSVASTEFMILRPQLGFSLEYLYLLARSGPFQERLRELSGGTSTSHQRAKPDDFLRIEVVVPPARVASRLVGAVTSQLHMARVLRVEISRLAAMRDLLLPRLVTGQIDVSSLDLDAVVGSVA